MLNQRRMKIMQLAVLAAVTATAGFTQGFDESSFDSPGGANAPAAQPGPSGSGAGGFGESSFDEDGFAPGGTVLPEPGGQPDPGAVVSAPGSSSGGFEEGSFGDGGGIADSGSSSPAGGGDFPGGTVLPEPGGSGGVAGVNPEPVLPPPGGNGRQPPSVATPSGPQIDPQITAVETRDFGVPPQNTLRHGQFHAPTPVAIPGANLVTTENLVSAISGGVQMVLIDVLGAEYTLPGAFTTAGLAYAGHFNDRTQQQAAVWLGQVTGGQRDMPIVIFCSDPMCWLSYNGVLRTVNAGYTNVYWYRGGLQAWQMAGLPLQPAGF